ncbi:MAG: hypothetical protein JXD22_02490 [Sedimentisphaerales bacterium]|nr:hypothetical protein [Sedimentisphaerales bacterium]
MLTGQLVTHAIVVRKPSGATAKLRSPVVFECVNHMLFVGWALAHAEFLQRYIMTLQQNIKAPKGRYTIAQGTALVCRIKKT